MDIPSQCLQVQPQTMPRQPVPLNGSGTLSAASSNLTRRQKSFLQRLGHEPTQALAAYTPEGQIAIIRNATHYIVTDSPTIADIRQIYGISAAEVWLGNQIHDLNEFAGVSKKLSIRQINDLATMMASAYYYIKLPEFMLFFARMKCGIYGRFYGCVDTMLITEAFQDFLRERTIILDRHEQELRQKRRLEQLDKPGNMDIQQWRSLRPFLRAGYDEQFHQAYIRWLSAWHWGAYRPSRHEPLNDPDPT